MIWFLKGTLKVALFLSIPLVIALAILRGFYVDVVTVGHNGMAPTLFAGDEVFVWRDALIEHGDVAVCHHPEEPSRYVMGRAIAMPGMSIGIERGGLMINGEGLSRDVRESVIFVDPTRDEARRVLQLSVESRGYDRYWVFEDENRPLRIRAIEEVEGIYLLGDHRGYAGEDSRAFGTVLASECVGEVFMLLRPGPQSIEEIPRSWLSFLGAD